MALSARVFVLGSAAPYRGSMNVWGAINPGLAPWAMREYRPYRAHLRLPYHFIILIRLLCIVLDEVEKKVFTFTSSLVKGLSALGKSKRRGRTAGMGRTTENA